MDNVKGANIGARLDRLPNSGWHTKMWLITAFALLVCWSNGIGGAVQNILLNEVHWLNLDRCYWLCGERLIQSDNCLEH